MERVGIRKSRCIESTLLRHTTELNATLSVCRVLRIAYYFFEFLEDPEALAGFEKGAAVVVVEAHPFAAEDDGLGHFLAICPMFLQNMQSFKSKHHFHSARVSLLSLPRNIEVVPEGFN